MRDVRELQSAESVLQAIINYRKEAGAINFQLEKMDVFIHQAEYLLYSDRPGDLCTSVKHCARCGGNHDDVLFRQLSRPVVVSGEERDTELTHWAPCPVNGDPILLRVVSTPEITE